MYRGLILALYCQVCGVRIISMLGILTPATFLIAASPPAHLQGATEDPVSPRMRLPDATALMKVVRHLPAVQRAAQMFATPIEHSVEEGSPGGDPTRSELHLGWELKVSQRRGQDGALHVIDVYYFKPETGRLIDSEFGSHDVKTSPDGRWQAWVEGVRDDRDHRSSSVLVRPTSGHGVPRMLATAAPGNTLDEVKALNHLLEFVAWSPDSHQLLFKYWLYTGDSCGHSVYLLAVDRDGRMSLYNETDLIAACRKRGLTLEPKIDWGVTVTGYTKDGRVRLTIAEDPAERVPPIPKQTCTIDLRCIPGRIPAFRPENDEERQHPKAEIETTPDQPAAIYYLELFGRLACHGLIHAPDQPGEPAAIDYWRSARRREIAERLAWLRSVIDDGTIPEVTISDAVRIIRELDVTSGSSELLEAVGSSTRELAALQKKHRRVCEADRRLTERLYGYRRGEAGRER